MPANNYFETIIIGGGQAGLSVARYLKEAGRSFLILEKNNKLGESWMNRYDSLILDSFAKYSHLEDFPFPGDQMRQPHKNEVVEYLNSFAKHFDLHPQFSTEVISIEKRGEFIVQTNKGTYNSEFVVIATGPFHYPFIPGFAKDVSKDIHQIHSNEYQNPNQLKPGSTLVVGAGNSGVEIVEEVALAGRRVFFSYKGKLKSVRSTHLSQWLAYRLGLAHVPNHTLLGKLILWHTKGKSVGMNVKELLKHPNIQSVGELKEVKNEEMIFSKAKIRKVGNIIWATGYRSDFSIVSIPDFDPNIHTRGATNIRGLYVLNIRWQYSKSSSHLAGISRDAKYIAKDIINKSNEKPN